MREGDPGASLLADRCVELQASRFGEGQCHPAGKPVRQCRRCPGRPSPCWAKSPRPDRDGDDAVWQTLPPGSDCGGFALLRPCQICPTVSVHGSARRARGDGPVPDPHSHPPGPYGVEGMNQLIADLLRESGWIRGNLVCGRQVLVTANDPGVRTLQWRPRRGAPRSGGRLAVWFVGSGRDAAACVPTRLPPHETARSPSRCTRARARVRRGAPGPSGTSSRVVTRELVVHRTHPRPPKVTVWSRDSVFPTVSRRIERASGFT